MNDIKRPSPNLKSRVDAQRVSTPVIRSNAQNIEIRRAPSANEYERLRERSRKVESLAERYEKNRYEADEDYIPQSSYRPKTQNLRNEMTKTRRKNRNIIAFTTLIVLGLIFLLLNYVFNYGIITLTPKSEYISINDKYDLPLSSYKIVDASESSSKQISSSQTKEVRSKAMGRITIYNNFDSNTQKLVPNTRFETKEGKVFRTVSSVVVPGKSADTPGSVEVQVAADAYGAEYNISPTTFTIPGFKGTARYALFTAQSKSAMTGGASGKSAVVSKDDIEDAKALLAPALEDKVKSQLLGVQDVGFVVVKDSVKFEYSDNRDKLMSSASTTNYQQTVKGKVLLVSKEQMYKLIARKNLAGYQEESVTLQSPEALLLSFSKDADLNSTSTLQLLFTYDGLIKYVINSDEVVHLVAGQDKTAAQKLLISKYYNVLSGDNALKIKLMPWWSGGFPSSINKIKVEENLPKAK